MKVDVDVKNNVSKMTNTIKREAPGTMAKALNKAGGIVKREAQRRAPSPKIASAIKVVGASNDTLEARVGFKYGKPGWYGKFIETGTKAHDVEPREPGGVLAIPLRAGKQEYTTKGGKKKTRSLFYTQDGGKSNKRRINVKLAGGTTIKKMNPLLKYSFFQKVNVEGVKKEPFLRPAEESKKNECRVVISEAQIKLIEKASRGVQHGKH